MNSHNQKITAEPVVIPKGNTQKKAYLALTATSLIWGTTWVASKFGVLYMPGLAVSYIRQFIAGTLILIFFFIKGHKLPTLRQFGWLMTLAVFAFVLANGFSTWSVKYMSSGLASLIGALYPLCVAIIEIVFLGNRNGKPLTFVGLVIGIGGVAVVFYENAFHEQPEGYEFGIILGLTAMLSWSIATILISRNKYQMNPYYAIGWQMLFGSFFLYVLAYFTNNTIPISEIPTQGWLAILYLIVMGSIIAFTAFIYTVKHLKPALASLYAYINPLVAMATGAFLLNEPLTLNLLIGAMITLFGVYLVNYSLKKG